MKIIEKILPNLIKQRKFLYILGGGNLGDNVINLGTIHLFEKLKFVYKIGSYLNYSYQNQVLVYAGGGNLVGFHKQCENFILNNYENNEIILLPHTIQNIDLLLKNKELTNKVTFFCREPVSYEYVSKFTDKVYLDHDLAFCLNKVFIDNFKNIKPKQKTAYCFRTDEEKLLPYSSTNKIENNDISFSLNDGGKGVIMFEYLSNYEEIHTDRLHVGIAGSLLNKNVFLYPNSYYKNKAVFEFSIKDYFPNTKFVETFNA